MKPGNKNSYKSLTDIKVNGKNFKYYSGLGSHKNEFTEKYILETINVLKSIKKNIKTLKGD